MTLKDAYASIYGDVSKHLLLIDRYDSVCAACGKKADPDEIAHISSWNWGELSQGCGVQFKYVGSHYGTSMKDTIMDRRTDLEWVSPIV